MKAMLEGEFRRFRRAQWFIKRFLVVVPFVILALAVDHLDTTLSLVAALVSIQNFVALWVLKQYD